jgi:hypothetical protein
MSKVNKFLKAIEIGKLKENEKNIDILEESRVINF